MTGRSWWSVSATSWATGGAASPSRRAHPLVAARAAERGTVAGGRPLSAVPHRAGDVPRVSAGRVRRAGAGRAYGARAAARGPGGGGGHADAVAVRLVVALR